LTIFLPNADEEFKEEERRENLPATLLLLVLLLPRRSVVVFVVKVSLVEFVVLAERLLLLTEKTTARFCAEFVGVIHNGSILSEEIFNNILLSRRMILYANDDDVFLLSIVLLCFARSSALCTRVCVRVFLCSSVK
jgi:hypothetical protein